ncbi:MAG TPA: GNAT family N-acetyltransferase [Gammaproteobacteria bacterium]|nr:GNAT family N-acetyltransferase [Gammaproteobacteria bacterium]
MNNSTNRVAAVAIIKVQEQKVDCDTIEREVGEKSHVHADNRLNPYKLLVAVHTLNKTIFFKNGMGIGMEKRLDIEDSIEFVLYPLGTTPMEYQYILMQELMKHREQYARKVEDSSCVSMTLFDREKLVAAISGISDARAFTADAPYLDADHPDAICFLLNDVVKALAPGIEKIYILSLPKNHCAVKPMLALGFHPIKTGHHSQINLWADLRELKGILLEKCRFIPPTALCITIDKEKVEACANEQCSNIQEDITEHFSCLLQNEDGQIVGGTFLLIEENTHLYIHLLWIYEMMRGQNLSVRLLALSEHYASQKKCTTAGVATESCYAHWIYPKLGYRRVATIPDGPNNEDYFYRKSLLTDKKADECTAVKFDTRLSLTQRSIVCYPTDYAKYL